MRYVIIQQNQYIKKDLYFLASTFAEMKKQVDREVLNLLSFTSIETLRGQYEKVFHVKLYEIVFFIHFVIPIPIINTVFEIPVIDNPVLLQNQG